jgi:Flp pilus assembly protein TadD
MGTQPSTHRGFLISLGLAVLSVGVFCVALRNGFVNFDDDLYVTENRQVLAGLTARSLSWAWTTLHAGYWQPMTWMSLQLDAQLFGRPAWGFHLTNVLWHAADVVLLFWVLRQMTGSTGRSAALAALFAVHPLRVESVAWVSERKDVLSTFFGLLALLAYVDYTRRPGLLRYALVMAALTVGLMAKPMLVTLPAVLLLLDFWPLRRWPGLPLRKLVVEKLPLLAVAVAFAAITVYAQESGRALLTLERVSVPVRLGNAVLAYGWYLGALFWPVGLAPTYPHPGPNLSWLHVAGVALVLLAISALAALQARRRPYLLVGWLWFLGTLVPVVGLLQAGEQPWADRFTYVPHIGLLLMLVWGGHDLIARRVGRPGRIAFTGAVVAAWAVASVIQVTRWRDSVTILEHALWVAPDNPVAHNTLGAALLQRDELDEAVKQFREAIRLDPGSVKAQFNLGVAFDRQRRAGEAIEQYQATLRLDPDFAPAHFNLGVQFAGQGRTAEAIDAFAQAVRLEPHFAPAHYNLAAALVEGGRPDDAAPHFTEAVHLDADFERMHLPMGLLLLAHDRAADAAEHFRAALNRDGSAAPVQYHLGRALAELGRGDEAVASFRRAAALQPLSPQFRAALAWALDRRGRPGEADAEYGVASQLDPQWPQAAARKAWTLATHPEARSRDGRLAVALAEQASRGTGGRDPRVEDALAAAYAEAGQFERAIAAARRAHELATADAALTRELEGRIRLYEKGLPYRTPAAR